MININNKFRLLINLTIICVLSVQTQAQTNIFPGSGNVGIGTINPVPLLSVYKSTNAINYGGYTAIEINNPNTSEGATSALVFRSGTVTAAGLSGAVGCLSSKAVDNNSQYLWLRAYSSAYPIYVGYDQNNLVIANGKIGVGTGSPTEKLTVKGTILAQKVRVSQAAADWPDYVFEKDYSLMPLDSVENFIAANKHLPNVPNADEVNKNGIDVGENQKILLQKIEELTLYIIKQDKAIESLQKRIDCLTNK